MASGKVARCRQHIVKAHVARNGAVVEEHVDVAAGVSMTLLIFQKRRDRGGWDQSARRPLRARAAHGPAASPAGGSAAPGTEPGG